MSTATCTDCGSTKEVSPQRGTCFRCHVHGVRLGFRHGKADFHGPTVRERQKEQEAIIATMPGGAERYVPVDRSRWV